MRRTAIVLIAIALLGLALGIAQAQGTPTIWWFIIGSGGGYAEAGDYALDATIGQAVVGVASNDGYELCAGFWCGAAAVGYRIYLPLVVRNAP